MVNIFGQSMRRDEVLRRVGDIGQIGGIELVELADGPERGNRAAIFRTGTGLEFTALPDRGMDIANASLCGIPFGWISPTGRTAPYLYDPEGLEWLRSFYGGLLVTCGLTYLGAPCVDEGEELGLHGRYSNIPARRLSVDEGWEGDDFVMRLRGEMAEAKVFQPTIKLGREIGARLGESELWVKDRVTNSGYDTSPHMILYHINIGFPVVDQGSKLVHNSSEVKPRDKEAESGKDEYMVFSSPVEKYSEQVFYHDLIPDDKGMVAVGIVNEAREIGVKVSYQKEQLPRLVEWKMMGESTYVVGIEPSNSWVEGRAKDRERGILHFLEPGESRDYQVTISFLSGRDALDFAGSV
ncbi:MAG: aldose 1-epimerase family protein [Theionarchaea archaeon]|nr:aldose 1-epimerase family protein [Theionarchaea archaeon]